MVTHKLRLILASSSPRRAEILRTAGFDFEIVTAQVDESLRAGEAPADYVRRLAEEKACSGARRLTRDVARDQVFIIGADTIVVIGDQILGKPSSAANACEMLRRISGRTHEVYTGLAILKGSGVPRAIVEKTRVTFAHLSEEEIEDYIRTGEPLDKAGAYGIQGRGGIFVTCIEGCYFNVMGLPLARLYSLLRETEAKCENSS